MCDCEKMSSTKLSINARKHVAKVIWQNLWENRDPSIIQCTFGPQESPHQTGPQSV